MRCPSCNAELFPVCAYCGKVREDWPPERRDRDDTKYCSDQCRTRYVSLQWLLRQVEKERETK